MCPAHELESSPLPGDEISPYEVDQLTKAEKEFHWLIMMGWFVLEDIAKLLRISPSAVSHRRTKSERKVPESEIVFGHMSHDRAVELKEEGHSHSWIARMMGIGREQTVSTMISRDKRKWQSPGGSVQDGSSEKDAPDSELPESPQYTIDNFGD